jgi:hypothetical protein
MALPFLLSFRNLHFTSPYNHVFVPVCLFKNVLQKRTPNPLFYLPLPQFFP